jgi:hypothetical protein
MHTDPDQESLWIAKWKDDIFILLSRSLSRTAESGQSIGDEHIVHLYLYIFFQLSVYF